jgi:ELWxxDGT repeat protein
MSPRAPSLRIVSFAVLLIFIAASHLGAQTADLVRDINVTIDPASQAPGSNPGNLFPWQGKLFFAAAQAASGTEPWVTDGTASGTQLLADVCPGSCSSSPQFYAGLGGLVVFGVFPDIPILEHGQQLWRSDGTRAGTFPLTDLTVTILTGGASRALVAVAGGQIFFNGCSTNPASPGCRLWASDGTPGGTRPVPGFGGDSEPHPDGPMVTAGGRLYLSAHGTTSSGTELWVTDGTAAGTAQVTGVPQNSGFTSLVAAADRVFFGVDAVLDANEQLWSVPVTGTAARRVPLPATLRFQTSLATAGRHAYFAGTDASGVSQLWVTDGSRAGTAPLTAFTSAQEPSFADLFGPPAVAEVGSRSIFRVGLAPGNQSQLWASAGSPAAPVKLADVALLVSSLATVGGRVLYATSAQPGSSLNLHATDGTPGGDRLLARGLCAGECGGSAIEGIGLAGGAAYFAADDGRGFQLWRSDGTPGGTGRFTDLTAQFPNLDPAILAVIGGELFFSASGAYGQELWKSNGAPGGTLMVADIARAEPSSGPAWLAALGGQLLFNAFDGGSRQLWQSTGTAAATSAISSFPPFFPGNDDSLSEPQQLAAAGGSMFFWRQDDNFTPYHLLRTDGTTGGTLALRDFPDLGYAFGSPPPPLAALAGRIYLAAPRDGGGASLWTSDGTPGGTVVAVDFPDLDTTLAGVATAGGQLFFTALGPRPDLEARLYRSDGTPAGTTLLLAGHFDVDFNLHVTAVEPAVFFILTRDLANRELWKTDGTPAGTVFVASLFVSQNFDPHPTDLTAFDGALFFFTSTGGGKRVLWRSDGSAAGTAQVRSFVVDSSSSGDVLAGGLTVFGDRLYFAANDGEHGRELWTSDGTAAGTAMLLDVFPGAFSSGPSWLTVAGGRLWFTADDGVHGIELWQSDGTAAGTRLVQDIAPGADSSYPDQLTAAGGLLYFTADDGAFGRELWALPLAGAGTGCQPTSTRLCLTANRFQVEAVWRDPQGRQGSGMAVPVTADTGTFWFFSPDNVELIVKVLDGRALNNSFWVFYGALSDVEYTITVTDTATGLVRRYFNPAGQLASSADTNAFGPLGEFSLPPPAQRASRAAPPVVAASPAPAAPPRATAAARSAAGCQASATRVCLNGGRFAVEAVWQDFQGHTGTGTAVPLSGDTGYFWFFGPDNVEVVLKVIDGQAINGKFWVFYGALSSVQYTLTVTDTLTGRVRTYQNPLGQLASVADTGAF